MKKSINLLPTIALSVVLSLAPFTAAWADTVVVRPGDTLSRIAERELGDKRRYEEICEHNLRTLRHDCNYLVVGTVLKLPGRGEATKPAVSRPAPVSQGPRNTITLKGDFVASLGRSGDQELRAPKGYEVTPLETYVEISGHKADASPGGKPGIWLRLPDSIEKRASGNLIVVKAVVRMRRTPGPITLAYSTHEVGNSGWVTKSAGTNFKTVSFTYRVPAMKIGGGDYIGILPDPRNVGQVLYVAEIAVDILGE